MVSRFHNFAVKCYIELSAMQSLYPDAINIYINSFNHCHAIRTIPTNVQVYSFLDAKSARCLDFNDQLT